MTSPKPISLTQVDAGDYAGPDPEPLVVVGTIPGGGGGGAVDSVNGKTGVVALSASDVGALPASTPIPNSPDDIGAATAAQGSKADTAVQPAALDAKVSTSRTVAGYALTADVPRAGLNIRGVAETIFLATGSPVPGGTPAYTVVIEG